MSATKPSVNRDHLRTTSDVLQLITAVVQLTTLVLGFMAGFALSQEGGRKPSNAPSPGIEIVDGGSLPIQMMEDPRGKTIHTEPVRLSTGEGTLFILADHYAWLRGQGGARRTSPRVVYKGRTVSEDQVIDHFQWPPLTAGLREASDVVAVGMASCEGEPVAEFHRAGHRADTILQWLRQAHGRGRFPGLKAWTLNLGRYDRECPDASPEATQFQRRLVLLALKRPDPTLILDNHDLIDAIGSSELLQVDPRDYEAATLSGPSPF